MIYNQTPKNVLTNNTMFQQPYKINSEGRLRILSDVNEYKRRKDLISEFVEEGKFCITNNRLYNPSESEIEMYQQIYDWSIEKILLFGEEVDLRDFDSPPPRRLTNKNDERKYFPYHIPYILMNESKNKYYFEGGVNLDSWGMGLSWTMYHEGNKQDHFYDTGCRIGSYGTCISQELVKEITNINGFIGPILPFLEISNYDGLKKKQFDLLYSQSNQVNTNKLLVSLIKNII